MDNKDPNAVPHAEFYAQRKAQRDLEDPNVPLPDAHKLQALEQLQQFRNSINGLNMRDRNAVAQLTDMLRKSYEPLGEIGYIAISLVAMEMGVKRMEG